MNERQEPTIRGRHLALCLLLLAIASAPLALIGEGAHAVALIAWLDVGPRVVDDGYVGGTAIPYPCNCTTDQDGVPCPGAGGEGTCGDQNYHGCPVVNQGGTHYCVGSGTCTYCGQGDDCPLIQYSTCVGGC